MATKKDNIRMYTIITVGIGALALAGIGVAKVVTSYPIDTIKTIVRSLKKFGITNVFTQAGILAVVSTEHGFTPKSEIGYSKTSAARIRATFDSSGTGRFSKMTDAQIDALKKDDVKFFDFVYGGMYGNAANEGYKYRGRGFNGITFKNTYLSKGIRVGVDLVNNPDLLNTVPVAADVLAAFFADGFKSAGVNPNQYTSLATATWDAFRINAGWGKDITKNTTLMAEHKKQLQNGPELLDIVKNAA